MTVGRSGCGARAQRAHARSPPPGSYAGCGWDETSPQSWRSAARSSTSPAACERLELRQQRVTRRGRHAARPPRPRAPRWKSLGPLVVAPAERLVPGPGASQAERRLRPLFVLELCTLCRRHAVKLVLAAASTGGIGPHLRASSGARRRPLGSPNEELSRRSKSHRAWSCLAWTLRLVLFAILAQLPQLGSALPGLARHAAPSSSMPGGASAVWRP